MSLWVSRRSHASVCLPENVFEAIASFCLFEEHVWLFASQDTDLPSPVCVVCCATVMAVSADKTSFTIKSRNLELLKLKKIKWKVFKLLPCYLTLFTHVYFGDLCLARAVFRNNGWTRSKVEKENKVCNLETHESPTRSNISPKKIVFARFAHTKKFMARERTVFQLRLGCLGQIWVRFGRVVRI